MHIWKALSITSSISDQGKACMQVACASSTAGAMGGPAELHMYIGVQDSLSILQQFLSREASGAVKLCTQALVMTGTTVISTDSQQQVL